jgi:hypothetical protein
LTPHTEGSPGRLPSLGQDHSTGHRTYVEESSPLVAPVAR